MLQHRPAATTVMAIAMMSLVAIAVSSLADAQDCPSCGTGNNIVSDGIISDGVINGGIVADGSVVGDTFEGAGSYVGDMSATDAGCIGRSYGMPDLFYNFYTQGNCNSVNAQMYLSPGPVPPNVGHTFYTYQPFYPHHLLYAHKDRYHKYYDNGRGMNRTRVSYYYRPLHTFVKNLYWNKIRIPR